MSLKTQLLRVHTQVKSMTCYCQVKYKEDVTILNDCNSVPVSHEVWLTKRVPSLIHSWPE